VANIGGSVYWFAARDKTGAFVDDGKLYKLTAPQPVSKLDGDDQR